MINKSVLFEAKAFLCWEKFPGLSIKLIPVETPVAFFYPPTRDLATINLFYEKDSRNFDQAICLLFHEAGHLIQWGKLSDQNQVDQFWELLNLDQGPGKIQFEQEAWQLGEELLLEFLIKMNLDHNSLINFYQHYAEQSLATYK